MLGMMNASMVQNMLGSKLKEKAKLVGIDHSPENSLGFLYEIGEKVALTIWVPKDLFLANSTTEVMTHEDLCRMKGVEYSFTQVEDAWVRHTPAVFDYKNDGHMMNVHQDAGSTDVVPATIVNMLMFLIGGIS
jgi:hypothetical protein